MKKSAFLVILLSFISCFAFAQTATTKTAKIDFKEKSYDFKEIKEGETVEHKFVFTNTGDAPLLLTNVSTTCGCTAPSWPREAIAPGEKGEILVKFNSTGKSGVQNKVITIFSNAANAQEQIKIVGNVAPKS